MSAGDGGRVLLRARSGPRAGMGHAMRTRAVALEVAALGGRPLVVVDDERSADAIAADGLDVETTGERARWCDEPACAAWIDGTGDWSAEADRLAERGMPAFLVENRGPAREASHRVVYPALHWVPDAWDERHAGRVLAGAGWIPLATEVRSQPADGERDVDLLVTFGGCDPYRSTERVLEALERGPATEACALWPRRIVVVVGPHMRDRRPALVDAYGSVPGIEILPAGERLPPWIARAHTAATAVGTTLYEMAFLGVPALVLANYAEDHDALGWYGEHGPHLPLGVAHELSAEGLRAALLAGFAAQRERARVHVPGLADGARRLARELLAAA